MTDILSNGRKLYKIDQNECKEEETFDFPFQLSCGQILFIKSPLDQKFYFELPVTQIRYRNSLNGFQYCYLCLKETSQCCRDV